MAKEQANEMRIIDPLPGESPDAALHAELLDGVNPDPLDVTATDLIVLFPEMDEQELATMLMLYTDDAHAANAVAREMFAPVE